MRKTLAVVLSAIMLMTACCFALPVSAAEGTPINTAADFAAMAADGTYYLNADITLDASYATAFTGTLDGNGKTVTVSAPMFLEFNGTIKNLTISGTITTPIMVGETLGAGAVAVKSTTGVIAENITSNVSISILGDDNYTVAGGLIGEDEGVERISEYTNCVNNGDIYVDAVYESDPENAKPRAAGMAAIATNVIFKNCVNNGDITCIGNKSMAAGLAARLVEQVAANTTEAYYCVNNGKIVAEDKLGQSLGNDAGGILGYIGGSGNLGFYRIYGCVNTGDVKSNYRVGSMCSYVYGSGANAFMDIEFCVNTGDIYCNAPAKADGSEYQCFGSHFIGYTNSAYTTIKYNISTGKVISNEGALSSFQCFVGLSSADATMYDITDNYILTGGMDGFTHYTFASADSNAHNRLDFAYGEQNNAWTIVSAEDLASGKVAVALNEAGQGYEGYYFYQTLGTDAVPTPFDTSKWVVDNNGIYANGEKPAETTPVETTTPAPAPGDDTTPAPAPGDDTTPAPKDDEKGGCGSVVALSILACMIPAAVVICKKKRD